MRSFQAYPQGMERNAVMMNTYARPMSPSSFSASGISRVMTILAIPMHRRSVYIQCMVNLHKQYTSTACASMTANVSLFKGRGGGTT